MSAHADLATCSWPLARADEALFELAQRSRLAPKPIRFAPASRASAELDLEIDESLENSALRMEIEVERIDVPYAECDAFLARSAPAIVRVVSASGEPRLVLILACGRERVRVLGPDGREARVSAEDLRRGWCAALESALAPMIEPILDAARLSSTRRTRARTALLAEHLGPAIVSDAWIVRLPPGRSLALQARRAGIFWRVAALALANFAASGIALLAWIALGNGALSGHFDAAWIAAWVLLLATAIPLRLLESWLQAVVAIRAGALFKRRLLAGAARLEPDVVRGEGAGHLLGRVLESEALESLALGAGFQILGASIDVAIAVFALAHGPTPSSSLLAFALVVTAAFALGLQHLSRTRRFADARLAMTQDLVERMVGHKTRIAQEQPERWHDEEDRLLESYLERSRELDHHSIWIANVLAGAWLVLGLAGVCVAFASGVASTSEVAIGLGGVLLAQQALTKLGGGLVQVATCTVAWRLVRPLFDSAARREAPGLPRAELEPDSRTSTGELGTTPLIEARGLAFRHEGRARAAIENVNVSVARGERVLVEGPSGGGKSTLAALFVGWRASTSGLLLLAGLDPASHGRAQWRRRVSAAPQFHENHVFSSQLAFNLLLGARGGSTQAERERARTICRELGLEPLIARMPSGLNQIVGETGWQLSHGEKSRLFIARALLQGGDLVVLDESFAALDPESTRAAFECVKRHSRALVVVAHP